MEEASGSRDESTAGIIDGGQTIASVFLKRRQKEFWFMNGV